MEHTSNKGPGQPKGDELDPTRLPEDIEGIQGDLPDRDNAYYDPHTEAEDDVNEIRAADDLDEPDPEDDDETLHSDFEK